jgi:Cu+-exporting ATPase
MPGTTDVRLDSTGMTCAACATRVERQLNRLLRVNLGNLLRAFADDAAALPAALPGLLDPIVAGGAMAASSVLMVGNSLRPARFRA